jgi:hypothetical protein
VREGRSSRCAIAARAAVAGAVLITATVVVAGGTATADGSKSASKGFKHCGTKTLYGKTLDIRVKGEMRSCQRVQRIIRGKCKIRRKHWSCFSFRTPDPPLVWFRSKELFDRRWSTVIEARRYPCADATLTSEDWNGPSREFPTRKQILSDDLIRCDLLDGMTIDEVEALLGEPSEHGGGRGHPYRDYSIGPERDSFFQVDSEVLSIQFTSKGIFRRASIYQS